MAAVWVTTLDNPYDFFTHFDEWYAFDIEKGYNTCAYMARIAKASNEMSEAEYDREIEDAVDEIVKMNLTGNYRKVYDTRKKKEEDVKEETEIELDELEEG